MKSRTTLGEWRQCRLCGVVDGLPTDSLNLKRRMRTISPCQVLTTFHKSPRHSGKGLPQGDYSLSGARGPKERVLPVLAEILLRTRTFRGECRYFGVGESGRREWRSVLFVG
jgi:hypothetical protein